MEKKNGSKFCAVALICWRTVFKMDRPRFLPLDSVLAVKFFFKIYLFIYFRPLFICPQKILKIKMSMKTVAYPGAGAELALPRHAVRSGSCKHALIGRQTG